METEKKTTFKSRSAVKTEEKPVKKEWTLNDLVKAQRGVNFKQRLPEPPRKPIVPPSITEAQAKRN